MVGPFSMGSRATGCGQTGEPPAPCAMLQQQSWQASAVASSSYSRPGSSSEQPVACQRPCTPKELLRGCFVGQLGAQARPSLAPEIRTLSLNAHELARGASKPDSAAVKTRSHDVLLVAPLQLRKPFQYHGAQPTRANPDLNTVPECLRNSYPTRTHPRLCTSQLNVNVSAPSPLPAKAPTQSTDKAAGRLKASVDLDSEACISRSASPKFKDSRLATELAEGTAEPIAGAQSASTSTSTATKVGRTTQEEEEEAPVDNLERSDLDDFHLTCSAGGAASVSTQDNNSGCGYLAEQLLLVVASQPASNKVARQVTNEQREEDYDRDNARGCKAESVIVVESSSKVAKSRSQHKQAYIARFSTEADRRRHSLPERVRGNIKTSLARGKSWDREVESRKGVVVDSASSFSIVGGGSCCSYTGNNLTNQQSSSNYTTAPLAPGPSTSQSSSVAGNLSHSEYLSARSKFSCEYQQTEATEEDMLSSASRVRPVSRARSVSDTGSATLTPDTEELEEEEEELEPQEMMDHDEEPVQEQQQDESSCEGQPKRLSGQLADMDDEQMRRLLTRKRLSEGCNMRLGGAILNRKNSLHLTEAGGLAQITEGEPMFQSGADSPCLLSSVCLAVRPQTLMSSKRGGGSQEESCSSSTSLERSPTRRRSSTVSQCSSVLSEGARNQLNFDLSPDLAPDSSLLEANALDIDLDEMEDPRPSSPEPRSERAESERYSRPESCMSSTDEQLLGERLSPDSTRDSAHNCDYFREEVFDNFDSFAPISETGIRRKSGRQSAELLERITNDVSSVVVSAIEFETKTLSSKRAAEPEADADISTNKLVKSGQYERARTPSSSSYPKPTNNLEEQVLQASKRLPS